MILFARLINLIFLVYTILIVIRILSSWFPGAQNNGFIRFTAQVTDPYLDLFRKIIPPLGMIDLSPIVALLALQLLKWGIFYLLTRIG